MDFLVQGISLLSPRGVLHCSKTHINLSKSATIVPTQKVNRLPEPFVQSTLKGEKKEEVTILVRNIYFLLIVLILFNK
jgi:hypothetical protein